MKIFARVCCSICVVCFTFLCVSAATGHMTIEPGFDIVAVDGLGIIKEED